MPFALVFLGLVMVVSGAKNTYKQLGAELISDFTGEGNFIWWVVAIGAVGSIGYYKPAKGFSSAFMALIVVSMLLAQQKNGAGGFFGQFTEALKSGPVSPTVDADKGQSTNLVHETEAPQINLPTAAASNSDAQETQNRC